MNPRVGMVRLVLKSFLVSLLTTFFLRAPAAAADGSREVVLLKRPALVKAVQEEEDYPGGFEIQIGYAGQTESVSTVLTGGIETYRDAVRRLRQEVAWRKPYLFVVSECGGGNSWSCYLEHVFRIEGKSFAKLGAFVAGTSAPSSYDRERGYFLDLYDKLEDSVSLCHAGSPSFQIVLRDRDGQLALDLEETWRMNRQDVEVLDTLVPQWAANPLKVFDDRPRDTHRVERVAKALAIALYCGRKEVADRIVAKTGPVLTEEDLEVLDEIKEQVRPGELPAEWRPDDEEDQSDDDSGDDGGEAQSPPVAGWQL